MGTYSELVKTQEFQSFVISLEEEYQEIGPSGRGLDKNIEKDELITEKIHQENKFHIFEDESKKGRLNVEETRFIGMVGHQVIAFYMGNGNLSLFFFIIITFSLATWASVSIDWWAGKWFNNDYSLTDPQFILIYSGLVFILMIFLVTRLPFQ